MDMRLEELAVYLATMTAVIDIMNKMPNATIKKVRAMLEDEVNHVREQIQKKEN
jgi:hypothetical protein